MPSAITETPPPLRKWNRPAKTTIDLPWADIQVIDISNFDTPGKKQKLAEQLRKAVCSVLILNASRLTCYKVHETGFFSIIGTGLTDKEIQRQYDIGQAFFELPAEEKGKPEYRCNFDVGNYFGYRAASIIPAI